MYEVATLQMVKHSPDTLDKPIPDKWTRQGKRRKKAEAIALANCFSCKAVVTKVNQSTVEYDNGQPPEMRYRVPGRVRSADFAS